MTYSSRNPNFSIANEHMIVLFRLADILYSPNLVQYGNCPLTHGRRVLENFCLINITIRCHFMKMVVPHVINHCYSANDTSVIHCTLNLSNIHYFHSIHFLFRNRYPLNRWVLCTYNISVHWVEELRIFCCKLALTERWGRYTSVFEFTLINEPAKWVAV